MGRQTQQLKSTGESVAQVTARKDVTLALEAQKTAWLASGLSMEEVAILQSAQAKKSRKEARHGDVMSRMPRERFRAKAVGQQVTICGNQYLAVVRADNPEKSMGWFLGDKVTIVVDGEELDCQIGLNITVIGSKPAK